MSRISIYSADGLLCDSVSASRLAKLEALGLIARVTYNGRTGEPRRAVLVLRPGEVKPLTKPPGRTKYHRVEHINDRPAYDLRHLGNSHGATYAPRDMRDVFLRVVSDCLVSAKDERSRDTSA